MNNDFTHLLIAQFAACLKAYDRHCPFTNYGQLEYHVETIQQLRDLGSAGAALNDDSFQRSLYRTLQAWKIGTRGSVLKPFPAFVGALQAKAGEIQNFAGLTIDQQNLDISGVAKRLASLVQTLDIVDNKARVVPGSKALHHLLPELVVPIDRAYTQRFFGWPTPRFQNFPEECFVEAFHAFVRIARATNPTQYVKNGWYTSRTKVIDNAVVGLWCRARYELNNPAS